MANIGLFLGRFQPFHRGHMAVVQGMMKVCDKVIVGLGSSQFSRTDFNPFSADERRQMIGAAIQGAEMDLEKFMLVEIPDLATDKDWVEHVLKLTGPITKVWSGNEMTLKLFEAANMPIQKISPVPGISATAIREAICSKKEWHTLVPKEILDWIIEHGGKDIVRESQGKSDPKERPELWRA